MTYFVKFKFTNTLKAFLYQKVHCGQMWRAHRCDEVEVDNRPFILLINDIKEQYTTLIDNYHNRNADKLAPYDSFRKMKDWYDSTPVGCRKKKFDKRNILRWLRNEFGKHECWSKKVYDTMEHMFDFLDNHWRDDLLDTFRDFMTKEDSSCTCIRKARLNFQGDGINVDHNGNPQHCWQQDGCPPDEFFSSDQVIHFR